MFSVHETYVSELCTSMSIVELIIIFATSDYIRLIAKSRQWYASHCVLTFTTGPLNWELFMVRCRDVVTGTVYKNRDYVTFHCISVMYNMSITPAYGGNCLSDMREMWIGLPI